MEIGSGADGNGVGILKAANGNWQIDGYGNARFSNATISGTLSSTVFEYDKVQTLSGSMIVRPGVYIEKAELTEENKIKIYLQSENIPEEIKIGTKILIGNDLSAETIYTVEEVNNEDKTIYI
jgi:hypothetical protein